MKDELQLAYASLRNMLLGGNLASLALIGDPYKMLLYATDNLFSFKSIANARGISQANVFDVFEGARNVDIRLSNLNGDTWFINRPSFAVDIVSLCLLCRALNPKTIFEIGTLHGYSSRHMALNTGDCRIWTLDLPSGASASLDISVTDTAISRSRENRKIENNTKITRVFGDSALFDFSPYHGKIDLFFIDGAHSYEYVKSDTLNALKCCHPGSIIAWHDFGRVSLNGVSKWLIEFSKEHKICSVPGGSLAFCSI